MIMNTLGLYEAHLDVSDLRTSIDFYTKKLGFRLAFRDPERRIAFLWVSQGKRHMIGLWEKEEIHRGHVAFSVTPEEIERAAAFLQERGIASRDFFGNPEAEPSVHAWMPAASVYFRDPDGHSLEYIALLPDEPRPELGVVPLSRWKELRRS
jgi:lactoylglutathione lyase